MWNGSKVAFASITSMGGADVGVANTFTEAQVISKDQDSELVALVLKNESDAADTSGRVSLRFDLEDTAGNVAGPGACYRTAPEQLPDK
jgi:long-subunit acyl-CoA synthetase (AMP-forming)